MNNNDNLLEEMQAKHDEAPKRYKRCQNCKYLIDNYKCKKLKVPFFDIAICPITKEKIEQKAKQHEVIGVKTDCPHFSTIGRLCSRVQNGMMRCDEYLECEFKYIDALKEENKALRKRFEELVSDLGWHCVQCTKEADNYRLRIENEKLKTVIQDIKQLVSTDYIKNKKQLVQNYDCLDNFMQKIEDKCNEVNQ